MQEQRQFFEQAQAMLRTGAVQMAIEVCEAGLDRFPADANLCCLAARIYIANNNLVDARRLVGVALEAHPDFAFAHDVNGDLLLIDGRTHAALEAWQESLRLDPARPFIAEKMAHTKQMQASEHQVSPRMAFSERIIEAMQLDKEGSTSEAEAIYRDILKKDPDHVEACRLLAGIATRLEHHGEAEVFLKRAVKLNPDYARAWVDLANVQLRLEDHPSATASARRVLELAPDQAESHMLLASIVGAAGQHQEAIETYGKVLELAPDKAAAMSSMAHHLKTIGRRDEAVARYRDAIAACDDHAESYWSLANLKTFRFTDDELAAMHSLLTRDSLNDEARVQVNNALGMEYEARNDYGQAFKHFEQCNLLRRRHESYDPVDTEETTDRVIELFDQARLGGDTGEKVEPTPIFIVGLPRSGSTLIEQILASHSQVKGTHELHDLARVVRDIRRRVPGQARFPDVFENFRKGGWGRLGRQYIDSTAKYHRGAPVFIDKNPNNFIFAGAIRLAMPNAKIIDARRHPLDSCLGSYKQLFASGQPFSYDLIELGEYYLQYRRVMDHWHAAMPGFVLDVHYENVVADLEGEVRRMLDYCGLPFEEACLNFHETERAVRTASSEQVRRPIYATSVNLWRNYEQQLGTLIEVLKPILEKLSSGSQPSN